MSDILELARTFSHSFIDHEKKSSEITEDILMQIVEKVSAINIIPGQTLDKFELFDILRADLSIGKGSVSVLSEDIDPWLYDYTNDWELWKRYASFMKQKDPSFPVNDLDDFTNKILDKCVNPSQEIPWDRRGMVVGHVQSGKTSNYVGLINKAADAGYKVVIVIAGTISSLRRQTQERIDEGFIGRSSSAYINNRGENKIIGVGRYKVSTDIYSLTSSYYKTGDEGDFSQSIANRLNIPIGKNPVVFVIKKNKSILENLIDWFSKDTNIKIIDGYPRLFDVPALVIDDEADAASVNTSKSIDEVKTINKLIRVLLNLFDKKTFVGYTATPYANLFISQLHNDELATTVKGRNYLVGPDLFPKDFIVNIKAPSNYIGAAKMFGLENPLTGEGSEPLDIFRPISDYDPPFFATINKNNKDQLPEYLPPTLEEAIKAFILTCAIRRVRGQEQKHNSMLIHVALYVKWIDKVAQVVNEKVREYKNAIVAEDKTILSELKKLFEDDFVPTTDNVLESLDYTDVRIQPLEWDAVSSHLKAAVSKIDVRSVHGVRSTTNLEYHNIEEIDYNKYENGLSVIAVGGSRLARGITLEGLSISYYLRTTKMYDSLMQMGRWFGYRPGYVDLCRLYTTEQIFDWFNHVTLATEEMRNDFDHLTATNKKPKDFRLKVRNHHGLLTITSVAKLNYTENITISFSGSNLQTYQLNKTEKVIDNNYTAFTTLLDSLGYPVEIIRNKDTDEVAKYLVYRNVATDLLNDFIDSYITNTPSIRNANISEYISKQQAEIKGWNIVVVSNPSSTVFVDLDGKSQKGERKKNKETLRYKLKWNNEELILGCSVRNQRTRREEKDYWISKNQIDDIMDRQIDLLEKPSSNEAIRAQRAIEGKGLLLLYALDPRVTSDTRDEVPIIGYSIYFPEIENENPISYTATVIEEFDEMPMEDDDNPEDENI